MILMCVLLLGRWVAHAGMYVCVWFHAEKCAEWLYDLIKKVLLGGQVETGKTQTLICECVFNVGCGAERKSVCVWNHGTIAHLLSACKFRQLHSCVYLSAHTHTGVFDIKELFVLDYGLVKYYACLNVSLFLSLCVQEPGPAKVTVTSTSSSSSMVCLPSTIAHAERVPSTRATLWQEETWSRATLPTSCSTGSLSQLGTNTQNSLETNKNKVMTCCVSLGVSHSADKILNPQNTC